MASEPAANLPVSVNVGMTVEDAERALIEATLASSGNNKTRAAAILGISIRTLHGKLNQYRNGGTEPVAKAAEA